MTILFRDIYFVHWCPQISELLQTLHTWFFLMVGRVHHLYSPIFTLVIIDLMLNGVCICFSFWVLAYIKYCKFGTSKSCDSLNTFIEWSVVIVEVRKILLMICWISTKWRRRNIYRGRQRPTCVYTGQALCFWHTTKPLSCVYKALPCVFGTRQTFWIP